MEAVESIEAVPPITSKRSYNRRSKRPDNFVPSFTIFERFTTRDQETGVVDVSEIFTKKCFDDWLSTRWNKNITHPEQSFQRVLYAHVRGADKRKPFSAVVEKALLDVLRVPADLSPWKEMFPNLHKKLGKRGFRSKGFHEALEESAQSTTTETPSAEEILVVRTEDPEPRSKRLLLGENIFLERRKFSPFDNKTSWDILQEVYREYGYSDIRTISVSEAASRGLEIYSPSLYFHLSEPVNKADIRFQWSFLIPPQNIDFWPEEPVGTFFCEGMVIVSESQAAVDILGGSSLGLHIYQIQQSILLLMYTATRSIPILAANGQIWLRQLLLRHDGRRIVTLVHFAFNGKDLKMSFQDHSILFTEALRIPMLF